MIKRLLLASTVALALTTAPALANTKHQQQRDAGNNAAGVVWIVAGFFALGGLLGKSGSSDTHIHVEGDGNTINTAEWEDSYGKPTAKKPSNSTGRKNKKSTKTRKESQGRKRVEVENPYFVRDYTDYTIPNEKGNFTEAYAADRDNPLCSTFEAKSFLYRGYEYGLEIAGDSFWVETYVFSSDERVNFRHEKFYSQGEAHDWAEEYVDAYLEGFDFAPHESMACSEAIVVKSKSKSKKEYKGKTSGEEFRDFDLDEVFGKPKPKGSSKYDNIDLNDVF